MADFSIKAHDNLPALRVQLQTASDELPVDLTNATGVKFIMTATVGGATIISTAGVIENAVQGIVRYDWTTANTSTPGQFLGEFEVTWTGGKKQTFPTGSYITIAILADLDNL